MKEEKNGRPPKYTSPEEYAKKIDEYIDQCEGEIIIGDDGKPLYDKWGQPVTTGHKPTLAGLAYFMGFESRQSLYDYGKKEEFSYSTKRARLFIESSYEEDLRTPGLSQHGTTFALKNMGWTDSQNLQHTTIDENGKEKGLEIVVKRASGN